MDPLTFRSEESDDEPEYANGMILMQRRRTSTGAGVHESCHRCGGRVYAAERVDIGPVFHQTCFRCIECNLTLSMNNFILCKPTENARKEVYCRAHVPKPVSHTLDEDAFNIRSAVRAQRIGKRLSFNNQVRLSSDMSGWEYDPKAMEFTHARVLCDRNRPLRRPGQERLPDDHVETIYERGDVWRKLKDGNMERESVHSLARNMTNKTGPTDRGEYMNPALLWEPNGHVMVMAGREIKRGDHPERHIREDPCYRSARIAKMGDKN